MDNINFDNVDDIKIPEKMKPLVNKATDEIFNTTIKELKRQTQIGIKKRLKEFGFNINTVKNNEKCCYFNSMISEENQRYVRINNMERESNNKMNDF